jgi:hypothetical protein
MKRSRKPHVVLKTGAVARPVPPASVPQPQASVPPRLAPEHARFLELLATELEAALREASVLPSRDRLTERLHRVRDGLLRIAAKRTVERVEIG